MVPEFLLIGNNRHPGIQAVSEGYKRAFEYLGIDFLYYAPPSDPASSIQQINALVEFKFSQINNKVPVVIMVQPSYLMSSTYTRLMEYSNIKKYAITTEDPYSAHTHLLIRKMFDIIFSNEKGMTAHGFQYLPVAFDSLQPYHHAPIKIHDMVFLATMYKERYEIAEKICKFNSDNKLDIFIGGVVNPLVRERIPVNIEILNSCIMQPISRHMELNLYSSAYTVINMHRNPNITGKSYFYLADGESCPAIPVIPYSLNPRFYDALGCGAFPICDRPEIFDILFFEHLSVFSLAMFLDNIKTYIEYCRDSQSIIKEVQQYILSQHTYINRAQTLMKEIFDNA